MFYNYLRYIAPRNTIRKCFFTYIQLLNIKYSNVFKINQIKLCLIHVNLDARYPECNTIDRLTCYVRQEAITVSSFYIQASQRHRLFVCLIPLSSCQSWLILSDYTSIKDTINTIFYLIRESSCGLIWYIMRKTRYIYFCCCLSSWIYM